AVCTPVTARRRTLARRTPCFDAPPPPQTYTLSLHDALPIFVAGRAVRLGGVGAGAVAIAGAGLVALVGRRAREGRAAAGPRRADVVLGARGAVVARRPVRFVGVRASAVAVAGAGLVALVGRRAGEGRARARAARADVILCARGAVVAGRPVRRVGVGAGA